MTSDERRVKLLEEMKNEALEEWESYLALSEKAHERYDKSVARGDDVPVKNALLASWNAVGNRSMEAMDRFYLAKQAWECGLMEVVQ